MSALQDRAIELAAGKVKDGYRPDIDTLRALAVLSVMLFHFGVQTFKGGFVGVDVFFVISGYLITKGILGRVRAGKFDFSSFYLRRVRRIIPALVAIIAVSYILAFFVFSPNDFKDMSGSAIFSMAGLSNMFFWMGSGYFDSSSSVKPLLHTWSLSVELQFYAIWPLVLVLIWKLPKFRIYVIALLCLTSLFLSQIVLKQDPSAAFYFAPLRLHEFLIGGMVVFLEGRKIGSKINEILYLLGLSLVLYSVFTYAEGKTIFPGLSSLPPTVGTALLLLTGGNSLTAKLISPLAVRKIGEISYSLYLVHWPIFVFAAYLITEQSPVWFPVLLVLLSFLCAMVLYAKIEKPLRFSPVAKNNDMLFSLGCACLIMFLMVPAATSWAQNGWTWRLPKEISEIHPLDLNKTGLYVWVNQTPLAQKESFEGNGKIKTLVIGDSQSADFVNLLVESGKAQQLDIVARTVYFECNTFDENVLNRDSYFSVENVHLVKRPDLKQVCQQQIAAANEQKLISEAQVIYVALQWEEFSLKYNVEAIQRLASKTNAKIYVLGGKRFSAPTYKIIQSFGRVIGLESYAYKLKDQDVLKINGVLSAIPGTNFVNVMSLICSNEEKKCQLFTDDKHLIYRDEMHFTQEGARFVAGKFVSLLNEKIPEPKD